MQPNAGLVIAPVMAVSPCCLLFGTIKIVFARIFAAQFAFAAIAAMRWSRGTHFALS